MAMLLYSLVLLWFAQEVHRNYQPLDCPWYASKAEPSLADMLATLGKACEARFCHWPSPGQGRDKSVSSWKARSPTRRETAKVEV